MHIVHLAAEVSPIAKVGGLADVIQGLSKEFIKLGHKVEILLPKYDTLPKYVTDQLVKTQECFTTYENNQPIENNIWRAEIDSMNLLFIETNHPKYYFKRGKIYGCADDAERFCFFAKAALDYLLKYKPSIDVLHIHDWQAALTAPLYHASYHDQGLNIKKIILTIHNLAYQGRISQNVLENLDIDLKKNAVWEKTKDLYEPNTINLLRGAIECATNITTVSPTYEKEIQTPALGQGLDKILRTHRNKLQGILNGIDPLFWDPQNDPLIPSHYPAKAANHNDLQLIRSHKKKNREHLSYLLGMEPSDAPLIATVSRLVPQKAPDLITHSLFRTLELNGQFILLGATPNDEVEQDFLNLKQDLADNPNAAVWLNKNEAIAHLIYAAADMIIVPSIFEPCGLTQLIGMRYGSIPIIRETGGLADTVFDVDHSIRPYAQRNGYTFQDPDTTGVDSALERAFKCYVSDQKKWNQLIHNGMNADLSWNKPAQAYLKLYAA